MPTISVILIVFNGERYLAQSVNSILGQSFKNFEFIIINDGSTDGTGHILAKYRTEDRVRIVENASNIGLTRSLNKAISIAEGRYIARMDADDISFTDRLEQQVDFMESHPDMGVVGSCYYEIDETGKKVGEVILPADDLEIRKALFKFNPFNHGTVMIRVEALKELGSYDEKLLHAQDYELWFRILSRYRGCNLSEKLLLRRNPKDSITVSMKREQIRDTVMALRLGRRYMRVSAIAYIHYLKYQLLRLIPSSMIPILRSLLSRERYRRLNKYYVIRL